MILSGFLFFLLGAVILGLACYVPHKERFTSDHTVGTMVMGLALCIACVAAGFIVMAK